jgi:hypothetical protein
LWKISDEEQRGTIPLFDARLPPFGYPSDVPKLSRTTAASFADKAFSFFVRLCRDST